MAAYPSHYRLSSTPTSFQGWRAATIASRENLAAAVTSERQELSTHVQSRVQQDSNYDAQLHVTIPQHFPTELYGLIFEDVLESTPLVFSLRQKAFKTLASVSKSWRKVVEGHPILAADVELRDEWCTCTPTEAPTSHELKLLTLRHVPLRLFASLSSSPTDWYPPLIQVIPRCDVLVLDVSFTSSHSPPPLVAGGFPSTLR